MATQILAAPAAIPFPATKDTQVSQFEITALLSLRNRARQLTDQIETAEAEILDRLLSGAPVEPGEHSAEIRESSRRSVSWREVAEHLAVKAFGRKRGELYCPKVLAATKPSMTRSLSIL